jgi:hypothetical protein
MKTIELHFDTSSLCDDRPDVFDAEELLERAVKLQFRWILIDWASVVQTYVFVEDDVMFLAMAYAELDEFSLTGQTHHIFLGDGLLEITAEREDENVTMTVCHTPHLDQRFSDTKLVKLQLSMYRRAWWSLMKQLLLQLQLG